jgi:hypothetical protein
MNFKNRLFIGKLFFHIMEKSDFIDKRIYRFY